MSVRYNTTHKQQLSGGHSQTLKNRASQDGGELATKPNPNKKGLFARFRSAEIQKELSEYTSDDFNRLNLGDYQDFAAKFFKLPKGTKDDEVGTTPTTQVVVFKKMINEWTSTDPKINNLKDIYLNGLALGLMSIKSPADINEKYITDKLNSIVPQKYLIQKYENLIKILFNEGTAARTRVYSLLKDLPETSIINKIFSKPVGKFEYMDQLDSLYQKMIEKNININLFYIQFISKLTAEDKKQEKDVIKKFCDAQNTGITNLQQNSLSGDLLSFFYGDLAVSTSEKKIVTKQNNCDRFTDEFIKNFNAANDQEKANSNYKELLKCNYTESDSDTVYNLFRKIGVKEITSADLIRNLNKIKLDTEKNIINTYLNKIDIIENITTAKELKYVYPKSVDLNTSISKFLESEYQKYYNLYNTSEFDDNKNEIQQLFSLAKQNNLKSLNVSELTKTDTIAKRAYPIIQELMKQTDFKDLYNPLQMNTLCVKTRNENCLQTTTDVAQAKRAHNNTSKRYDDILNQSLAFYKKYESYITDKYQYLNNYSLEQLDRVLFGKQNIKIKQLEIDNANKLNAMPNPTNGKLTFTPGYYPIYIGQNMLRIISNHKAILGKPFIYASNFNLTPTVYINGRQNIYNSTTPSGNYYVMEVLDKNATLDYKSFDNPNERKVLGILSSLSTMDLNSQGQTISSGLLSAAKTVLGTNTQSQGSSLVGGGPIGNIFKNIARKFKSVKKRKFGKKQATIKKSAKSGHK